MAHKLWVGYTRRDDVSEDQWLERSEYHDDWMNQTPDKPEWGNPVPPPPPEPEPQEPESAPAPAEPAQEPEQ